MSEFEITPRNKVRRLADRASYDAEAVYAVIDAAPVCHVAFIVDGQPFSIPTQHARIGNTLLLHGSPGSRLIRHVQSGRPLCISFVLVDGLVVARSIFHHSINYRSAVVFGTGHKVEGTDGLLEALHAFAEKILPGRWDEARRPSPEELRVTAAVAIEIESASLKQRAGDPGDDAEDLDLPIWAGLVPLRPAAGPAESRASQPVPASVQAYLKAVNGE